MWHRDRAVVVLVVFGVVAGFGVSRLIEARDERIRQDALNNPGRYFEMACAPAKMVFESDE